MRQCKPFFSLRVSPGMHIQYISLINIIIAVESHYAVATSSAVMKPFQEPEKLLRVLYAGCMHHQPSHTLSSIDIQRLLPLAARSWWIQIESRKGTERLSVARAFMYIYIKKKKSLTVAAVSERRMLSESWWDEPMGRTQGGEMHDGGSLNILVRQL